ncbi:M48 family metalloprotease [Primorskyibacter sp. S187A]|uniref:M48 family metalloprotease n=1 Tax=Primorskyibacter sp. S187A TaxID=3415130 RepID=UPI003C79B111
MPKIIPVVLVTVLTLAALPAQARGIIRDADIEYALRQLAAPVLQAAGLNAKRTKIIVINDGSLNAFVADSRHIFLHSGLILKLQNARSLQAVIAHEAAHITNGHITRRAGNARAARSAAGLGLVLAAAAAASGAPEAAAGIAAGSRSSAMRRFFAHTRSEEASADATSIRTLVNAGIDPRGALEVQELFRGQEALTAGRQDPYNRTHPLTRDRIRANEATIAGVRGTFKDRPADAYWFARAQGKLSAFTRAPRWTLRRAGSSPSSDIAEMRRAVAYHRQSNLGKALTHMDKAIALRPNDPFLRELKGQILLENRKFSQAAQVYGQAAKMAKGDALILGGLGRAQLAAGQVNAALKTLETARARDFSDPRILRDLAVAYARAGNNAMASLATAERYALAGRLKDARINAARAEGLLPRGSGPWQRAQDVLSATRNLR